MCVVDSFGVPHSTKQRASTLAKPAPVGLSGSREAGRVAGGCESRTDRESVAGGRHPDLL